MLGLVPVRHDVTAGREVGLLPLPAGFGYRLPTEFEWEYAWWAGTAKRLSFGDDSGALDVAE